jgi:hypothetical protein
LQSVYELRFINRSRFVFLQIRANKKACQEKNFISEIFCEFGGKNRGRGNGSVKK